MLVEPLAVLLSMMDIMEPSTRARRDDKSVTSSFKNPLEFPFYCSIATLSSVSATLFNTNTVSFSSGFRYRRCNIRVGSRRTGEQLGPCAGGFVSLFICYWFARSSAGLMVTVKKILARFESQFPTRWGHISNEKPCDRSWAPGTATLHTNRPTQVSQCFEQCLRRGRHAVHSFACPEVPVASQRGGTTHKPRIFRVQNLPRLSQWNLGARGRQTCLTTAQCRSNLGPTSLPWTARCQGERRLAKVGEPQCHTLPLDLYAFCLPQFQIERDRANTSTWEHELYSGCDLLAPRISPCTAFL